jgi:hypothetical protein
VNALSDSTVGEYLDQHFVAAYQKVGTFRVVNGQKQGGNVASYFCLPDGTVLHAVPGPVNAATFLREARFAVELHKQAATDARDDAMKYRQAVREAHYERLVSEYNVHLPSAVLAGPRSVVTEQPLRVGQVKKRGTQAQALALLAAYPLARLEALYPTVWEVVLNEKLSAAPVVTR